MHSNFPAFNGLWTRILGVFEGRLCSPGCFGSSGGQVNSCIHVQNAKGARISNGLLSC